MVENHSLNEYRQHLIIAEQKSQDDYDKAVLSLAGGGFAVSFIFIEKVTNHGHPLHIWLLASAWLCWGLTIAVVLASYYFSQKALRKAIDQCDSKQPLPRQPGGVMAFVTKILNSLSGGFFLLGLLSIALFVAFNLESK